MCGRYEFNLGTFKKSQEYKAQIEKQKLEGYKVGEVFPSDNCLAIIPNEKGIELKILKWGINNNGFIINARNETIKQRKTFKDLKRCAIIASGFYEWKNKIKYYINTKDEFIYLASLYDEENNMVIITKQSDSSFNHIHERIPVIMNQEEMLAYLKLNTNQIKNKELIIKECKVI